jgi:cytochrome P450
MNKQLEDFNFFDPEVVKHPFEFYDKLRAEAPVYQIPGTEMYLITSYKDVKEVARKHKIFSSEMDGLMRGITPDPEIVEIMAEGYPPVATMLTRDAPAHNRYRAIVNPAFAESRVVKMREKMDGIVDELIAKLPDSGYVDFFHEFCVHLPVWVIADALGVPRSDLDKFKYWSDCSVSQISGMATKEESIRDAKAVVEFQHYFAEMIEHRRDNPSDDVVSILVNSEVDEEPLDVPEMLSIIQQILVAGNETTTATLAGGMVHLIQRPDVLERLRAEPALIPAFVEEILRLETPSAGMWRFVLEDTEIGGVKMAKGAQAMIRWASGNRDETIFDNGAEIDLDRTNMDKHMAFGYGIHACLGVHLSRQELNVAFEQIIKKIASWKLAEGHEELVYVPSVLLRGLGELHLEIEKA